MDNNLTSQSAQILDWMQKGNAITQLQAMRKFGCLRLSARIFDLRADGHEVERVTVKTKNRNGYTTQFAKYYLKGKLGVE